MLCKEFPVARDSRPRARQSKSRFTNLTIALIEEGGSHAVFHDNPIETMKHIGSFAKRTQKNVCI